VLEDWHRITASPEHLLDLNEALERLAAEEPRKAELVTLRFFGGLSMPDAADTLGVSLPTAERWWAFARAWLYAELSDAPEIDSKNP
jgi:DNA-directed RNA polymerase specialized sigma24 family protein